MKKIELFEPAMCCSTGVCGPSVDKELIQTTAIQRYVSVNAQGQAMFIRRNLAQNPDTFVRNPIVAQELKRQGINALPITLVDGQLVKTGEYPTINEFSSYLDMDLVAALVH
ncbi:arsenite efflux transporter metallochaperone ArsD [Lacticaseibacillus rhamnosus]|uniref:arsenite efflux transporter metallochaperone ArsD n=1 Tax=Lacticaseibacillus rhamnosus TaxID=47715 RepID=UPI00242A300B|nr:arsenite efflux transporter metallochaperone ArsD [Lacticaseibacillus rhamnosus]GMB72581.1 repressor [Lacticaseibacillus rhamnosus]